MPAMQTLRTVHGFSLDVSAAWLAAGRPSDSCPATGTGGLAVKQVTLGNHVAPEHWRWVASEGFHFCPEPSCPIIYFNNAAGAYFTQQEIRTRVGIKTGPSPTPVCYCTNVTAEDIAEEIQVKGCCKSLEDIMRYTHARTGKFCHITNPAGRCCGKHVAEIVERALANINDEGIEGQARHACCQIPRD